MKKLHSTVVVLLLALFSLLVLSTTAQAASYSTPTVSSLSSSAQVDSSNAWYNGTISFSASATDTSGLTSLNLYWDDGSGGTLEESVAENGSTSTGAQTFKLPTTGDGQNIPGVPDGDDCFYVQAVGRGAEKAASEDYCVNISNTAPEAVANLMWNPSDPSVTWQSETTSDFSFDEPSNEPAGDLPGNVFYTVNGGATQSTIDNDGDVTLSNLPNGNDTVCIWLQDLAGNSDPSTKSCTTAQIDRASPTVGAVTYSAADQSISFDIGTGGSGLSTVTVDVVLGNSNYELTGSVTNGVWTGSFKSATPGTWTAEIDAFSNSNVETDLKEKFTVPSVAPTNTAKPSVVKPRKVKVGANLGSKVGAWSGTGAFTYTRQWQVKKSGKWVDISHATKANLKIAKAESGKQVRVGVEAKDSFGKSGWVYSAAAKA